jgi:two-component system chemotaxis sensor kinase CheA
MKKLGMSKFLESFESEAKAHINTIEAAFLHTDSLLGDAELMNGVFRAAHSLKGSAGFYSLDKVVAVSHEMESIFAKIRDGKLFIDAEIADLVFCGVDCLKDLIDNAQDDSLVDIGPLIAALRKCSGGAEGQTGGYAADDVPLPFDFSDEDTADVLKGAIRHGHKLYYVHIYYDNALGGLFGNPNELLDCVATVGNIAEAQISDKNDKLRGTVIRERDMGLMAERFVQSLAKYAEPAVELLVTSVLNYDLLQIALDINGVYIQPIHNDAVYNAEPSSAVNTAGEKVYIKAGGDRNISIRLDISVINGIMDLANEMILVRNQLFSVASAHVKNIAGLAPVLSDVNRLTSEAQEKIMLTRMQPISAVFNKFPRIIRDTAKILNKNIGVNIVRDDVTLDKYLLEALTDPITQLVKNSADHGLESAERRAELGKPQKGTITLNAVTNDGMAIIEITDDGRGIDTDALRRRSAERGILTEAELEKITDAEICSRLIFEPGVSTSDQITNLSGRGFGMNIVKNNIERLKGTIEIDTVKDKGTTVRLKMPLSLSVIRTLIVTIDGNHYAVPDQNVERIVRVRHGESASVRVERVNRSLVLVTDNRIMPIVTMGEIDAKARGAEPVPADERLGRGMRSGVSKYLVLRTNGRLFALMIDDALDTEQVLVKQLPVYLRDCPFYSNVTVLGNGRAVLVLDAEGIRRFLGLDADEADINEPVIGAADAAKAEEMDDAKQVLVFRCSGPEYYGVELDEVQRIDTLNKGDIQEIGGGLYVTVKERTVRLLQPEDFAPVRKAEYVSEKLYMVTLKEKGMLPFGFLAQKIVDKYEGVFAPDNRRFRNEYINGTGVYDGKIVIFLNAASIKDAVLQDKIIRRRVPRKDGAS